MHTSWVRNLVVTAIVAVAIGWFVLSARQQSGFVVPPIDGYMEGHKVRFIHTEASDPKVAQLLTQMKGSPVLLVPSLAKVPPESLADVYVFTNGVRGEGPFKFQSDVFDAPPQTPSYSPLRNVVLVSWVRREEARELKSAREVQEALAQRQIEVKRPGVVVNMPMITWPPDGRR